MLIVSTIFLSFVARVLAIQSSNRSLRSELDPTSSDEQQENDPESIIIEENEKGDDDPCWRRYSGYLYVYEKTIPKVVPAWVNGSTLNLGDNLISLSTIALPILPQSTDPRCFKMVVQDFGDPIVMCCATMQCRSQWINAITKSRFCNALMLGSATKGGEEDEAAAHSPNPGATPEPTIKNSSPDKETESSSTQDQSQTKSDGEVGLGDDVENLDDMFDEYLFIIRPSAGQKVEIEE